MIQNISIAIFVIQWFGAIFQTPPIHPDLANPTHSLQEIAVGNFSSPLNDIEFLVRPEFTQELTPLNDEYEVNQNETLTVDPPGVMGNDIFDEGAISTLVDPTTHGDVVLGEDGSFAYTPVTDFIGIDSFTYQLELDEVTSVTAVVQIAVIDSLPPQVQWISPVSNEGILIVGFETVLLEAEAMDNDSLSRVQFYRWDAVMNQYEDLAFVDTAPYQYELDTKKLNRGWNQIYVRAYDTTENVSERARILLLLVPRLFLPVLLNSDQGLEPDLSN